MKQGFILTEVICKTCQMSVTVQPSIADTLDIVKQAAAKIHTEFDNGAICPKPLLIEIYSNCLVSNEIFNPAPRIILPNGSH